jgi:thiopurine S-methyltransferase
MNDLDFWRRAWTEGRFASRVRGPDDTLETYWPSLRVPPGSRVLVPLSGKSGGLTWLASHGFTTVGVEVAITPCQEFFAERGVQPVRTADGAFTKWEGAGVTILQGDFFDLNDAYDAALDRGALVAFAPQDRARYVNHLKASLAPNAPILLVTIEFDPGREAGPPYPVFPTDMHFLFPASTELARRPIRRPRWDKIGGADMVVWSVFAQEACA